MVIIDRGSGPPLVVIPTLHGRWEYIGPAVDALSAYFRVITFSLCDEPSAHAPCDRTRGLDAYADHVEAVLEEKRLRRAVICGISFGGLIATRFAATHPSSTAALILVSTPPWNLRLRRRHQLYLRAPWLLGPLLLAESPWRLRPEVHLALPDPIERRQWSRTALKMFFTTPVSPGRMAVRARLMTNLDLRSDCARIAAPTLLVTGEPGRDYVVPVSGSSQYACHIPGARSVVLERTGHLGSVTRPEAFAAIVRDFVATDARVRWPDAAA
jgi:pimeloyl-ACP methyl ester carboxylesterase